MTFRSKTHYQSNNRQCSFCDIFRGVGETHRKLKELEKNFKVAIDKRLAADMYRERVSPGIVRCQVRSPCEVQTHFSRNMDLTER